MRKKGLYEPKHLRLLSIMIDKQIMRAQHKEEEKRKTGIFSSFKNVFKQ